MRRPEKVYMITGLDGNYVVSGLANKISGVRVIVSIEFVRFRIAAEL